MSLLALSLLASGCTQEGKEALSPFRFLIWSLSVFSFVCFWKFSCLKFHCVLCKWIFSLISSIIFLKHWHVFVVELWKLHSHGAINFYLFTKYLLPLFWETDSFVQFFNNYFYNTSCVPYTMTYTHHQIWKNASILHHASSAPLSLCTIMSLFRSDNCAFCNLPNLCFSLQLWLIHHIAQQMKDYISFFLYIINSFSSSSYSYFLISLFLNLILFFSVTFNHFKSTYLIVYFSCSLISISVDINFVISVSVYLLCGGSFP